MPAEVRGWDKAMSGWGRIGDLCDHWGRRWDGRVLYWCPAAELGMNLEDWIWRVEGGVTSCSETVHFPDTSGHCTVSAVRPAQPCLSGCGDSVYCDVLIV